MRLLAVSCSRVMTKTPVERIFSRKWIFISDFRRFDSGVKETWGFFYEDFIPQPGINE